MRQFLSAFVIVLALCALGGCKENKALDEKAAQSLPKFVIPESGLQSWEEGKDFVKLTLTADESLQFNQYAKEHLDQEIGIYMGPAFLMAPTMQSLTGGPDIYLMGLDEAGKAKIIGLLPPDLNRVKAQ